MIEKDIFCVAVVLYIVWYIEGKNRIDNNKKIEIEREKRERAKDI